MLDAPLFAEELAKVRAAVVRALEANEALPVEVLSASRLATLRAVAKAGKLREGGKKCAVAPTEDDVILAAHPKVLSGTFSLPCLGARCNLDVAVVPFEFGTRQFGTAPLLEAGGTPSDPTSVPSWEQTIASDDNEPRAGKATTGGGVGLGARGGLLGEFSFHVRGAFGFAKTPTDESFAGVVAKAKECGTKTAGQILLAVDAKGKVTRCEAESPCLCRVFSKQTFDAGAEGRRLVAFVQEAGELGGSPGAVGWGSAGLLPGPNGPRVRPSSNRASAPSPRASAKRAPARPSNSTPPSTRPAASPQRASTRATSPKNKAPACSASRRPSATDAPTPPATSYRCGTTSSPVEGQLQAFGATHISFGNHPTLLTTTPFGCPPPTPLILREISGRAARPRRC
jgi:hypothetical protein